MTKQSLKSSASLVLAAFLVSLWMAGIFYLVDVPHLVRGAILSQLDYAVHCVSLGGVTAGACDDAE